MSKDKDNIVISGISGRFPQCHNMQEFKNALLSGEDLVKEDSSRYPAGIWNTPKRSGLIPDIDKFDASFFGIHPKQVTTTDPRHRVLLERVYETIIDAGYNPSEIRGRKIGVYVGIGTFRKCEEYSKIQTDGYFNIGVNLALAANRISYCFNLKGPSYALDTACSTSLYVFTNAVKDMQMGVTEGALVCATHLIQHPNETEEFNFLNMLSPEGKCKVYSTERNGYVRAEAVSCCFLQRKSNSRRIYATVRGASCNNEGFTIKGITFPSKEEQFTLIDELYKTVNIDPSEVFYVESHGTGTLAGDPVESQSILDHFCQNRKDPLLIGSVKSNMGHSEVAAGMCSLAKVLLAMESGVIPANLHWEPLDKTLPGFKDNKLKLVTENTKWDGGIIGINSYGFGGSNGHIILESHKKEKKNNIYKRHKNRLVQVSGRTKEAVDYFLDQIEKNQNDEEFLALVDEIHKLNIDGHSYRGYIILGDSVVKQADKCTPNRPIWFVYTGLGCQWNRMGKDLLNIDVFRQTITRCAKALEPHGIDLLHNITSDDPSIFDNIANAISAIGCVEIALTDVLVSLGIKPDGFCGHSLGEVGCAYMDGTLTVEQAALLAYSRGYASLNTKLAPCQMAAVGLSKEEALKILPSDIFIACQNAKNSVTISGPKEMTLALVDKLKSQGIFAKAVNTANIAYHTKYVWEAGKLMLDFCKKVITDPKPRTSRWISSSVPPSKQHEKWAQLNCAEYHHNNFCNTVLFDQVYDHIPKNAVVIEVSPHGLLQTILKRELGSDTTSISITNWSNEDNEKFLLTALGKIYLAGGQPNLRNMYSDVTFPVSRGTQMLSPFVRWDHNVSWFTGKWENKSFYGDVITVSLTDEKYSYLEGHNIDGRILMPAAGYLTLVWEALAKLQLTNMEELPVVFENVKFKSASILTSGESVKFLVNIFFQTGTFEISEGGSVVCTGMIRNPKNITAEFKQGIPENTNARGITMNREDFYKECYLRRYLYKNSFQGIMEFDLDTFNAILEWKENFCGFLDTMFQMTIPFKATRELLIPTSVQKVTIDYAEHLQISKLRKGIHATFDSDLNIIRSGGIEVVDLNFVRAPRRQHIQKEPHLESYEFVSYDSPTNKYEFDEALRIAIQILLQNTVGLLKIIKVCEIITEETNENFISNIKDILKTQPMTTVECNASTLKNLTSKCDLIVISENLFNANIVNKLVNNLTDTGFILFQGIYKANYNSLQTVYRTVPFSLLRPVCDLPDNYCIVNVSNSDFEWLEKLKSLLDTGDPPVVYLSNQDKENSGIIGLVKCLLTEINKKPLRCVFTDKSANQFSLDDEFYSNQLKKNLTFNVLDNNNWGTFVHLPLKEIEKRKVCNAAVTISTIGDLSTLDWIEMPSDSLRLFDESEPVYVYYSALNFKDVMVATGKLFIENTIKTPFTTNVKIGMEYSGVTFNGKRVMGVRYGDSICLQIYDSSILSWEIPKEWSLQEACTVPVVFATCYAALILKGQMQQGESILIHAGTGGVGIAAIRIALSMGCRVFTTVSTEEKRAFLKKEFPILQDENIGYSRNASFEDMIKNSTKGKGVDLVLNSLAGDLFQASLRCLAKRGRFLEIGKVDLINSSIIPSTMFLRNISFHGVHVDKLFEHNKSIVKLRNLVQIGIDDGVVKPLPSKVFEENEVETAIRFLASAKHIGKVLIKIRDEKTTPLKSPIRSILATPQIYFDPKKSYIVIGGLGGMGLELTDWMITKGAAKIILNSRTNIRNGYQVYCFKKWSQNKGIIVQVNTDDTSNLIEAENLVKLAQKLGPVGGIFNLALVLKEAKLSDQSKENFQQVFKAKIISGQNMDTISRKLCPEMDHFVVFSSFTSGRGNIGQTNYGMANSALERLCEKRKRDRLPGLAVQWGPVGEVGVLSRKGIEDKLFTTIQAQKIASCLKALEKFMLQSCAVGSSVVMKEKNKFSGIQVTKTPINTVAYILGINNMDLIDKSLKLSQIGLDSLMLAEIKQTLYRNFNLEFNEEKIQEFTLNYLAGLEITSSEAAA